MPRKSRKITCVEILKCGGCGALSVRVNGTVLIECPDNLHKPPLHCSPRNDWSVIWAFSTSRFDVVVKSQE